MCWFVISRILRDSVTAHALRALTASLVSATRHRGCMPEFYARMRCDGSQKLRGNAPQHLNQLVTTPRGCESGSHMAPACAPSTGQV